MGKNFWQNLKRPFWVLAPMEDVTDTVFRQMIVGFGKPDVMFTEFTNAAGVDYAFANSAASVLETPALQRLAFSQNERPLVAQLWGIEPGQFFRAAKHVAEMGFDGVDINFGCPAREVTRHGACSAMIGRTAIVAEIIQAVREGSRLPVSVKTRIGFKKIVTEEWIGFLLGQSLAAITIHGRTAAEMSAVPAHWDEIGKAVKLRDIAAKSLTNVPLIIGNGDVKSLAEAEERVREYGVDGVMIGRGALENPWVFGGREPGRGERIEAYLNHIKLWRETWGERKNWVEVRKFAKAYIRGWAGAVEDRSGLMEAQSLEELTGKLEAMFALAGSENDTRAGF